ncbi:hypothetical protein ACHAXH_007394 [Discostella pseudostelligera]
MYCILEQPDYQKYQRLTSCLHSSKMHCFPAYEIKSVLHALAEKCQCANIRSGAQGRKVSNNDQQLDSLPAPHKRVKRSSINNNLHVILRFVDRIIHQRYKKSSKSTCTHDGSIDDDNRFLDLRSKCYFGIQDAAFQIEEDILSLAFEIALNAILHLVESDDAPGNLSSVDGGKIQSALDDGSTTRGAQVNRLRDGIIQTALEIVDVVVDVDRQERIAHLRLQRRQQAKNMSGLMLSSDKATAVTTDRRRKYEHLLKTDNHRGNKIDKNQAKPSFTDIEVTTIIEEKYSEQWEWLCRWRTSFAEEEKAAALGPLEYDTSSLIDEKKGQISTDNSIVIIRRNINLLDDMSLSSDDCNVELNDETTIPIATKLDCNLMIAPAVDVQATPETEEIVSSPSAALDHEACELRLTLLDMPPSESSSAEVIRHTVAEVQNLLLRYGELDGAAGIRRCGDIMRGTLTIDDHRTNMERNVNENTALIDNFPLNEAMVSSLVTAFLTDATGAIRAKAFLRAFVLPLIMDMNPSSGSSAAGDKTAPHNEGKPASRMLTLLLASLARDRPTECVVSVVVPTLVSRRQLPSIATLSEASPEPTRFQCELISRILREGKDSLSIQAIALLVEEVLPTSEVEFGMKWTDNTMPVLTACLNRQPSLSDEVVVKLADEISYHLTSSSSSTSTAQSVMANSMKFSTLFHAIVTKYGPQLKSTGKVGSLKESSTRLKTFMSKTIALSLKKLS